MHKRFTNTYACKKAIPNSNTQIAKINNKGKIAIKKYLFKKVIPKLDKIFNNV